MSHNRMTINDQHEDKIGTSPPPLRRNSLTHSSAFTYLLDLPGIDDEHDVLNGDAGLGDVVTVDVQWPAEVAASPVPVPSSSH